MFADVNYYAVFVAAVASMAIGYVWYGPLMGKQWMAAAGVNPNAGDRSDMPKTYLVTYLLSVLAALVLAKFVNWAAAAGAMDGAVVGLYVAVGFTFTTVAMNNMYEMRSMNLTWINTGFALVSFAVMGAILAWWPY
jgi:hypothetical protein